MPTTEQERQAALEVVRAVRDAIRALGEVPSGHLYAQLCGHLSLAQYTAVIDVLKAAGVVTESNHVLRYVPKAP